MRLPLLAQAYGPLRSIPQSRESDSAVEAAAVGEGDAAGTARAVDSPSPSVRRPSTDLHRVAADASAGSTPTAARLPPTCQPGSSGSAAHGRGDPRLGAAAGRESDWELHAHPRRTEEARRPSPPPANGGLVGRRLANVNSLPVKDFRRRPPAAKVFAARGLGGPMGNPRHKSSACPAQTSRGFAAPLWLRYQARNRSVGNGLPDAFFRV